ncbi:MAG: TSUP family transporter [Bacteroidetes bacterium]|jgi:uncharacterized membrane protein YfcA|nr:TSUP family transporter [Bacteroidota bacterium]
MGLDLLLLLLAGLAAGFVAGLVGVGGGIIFAPVLFFYFQAAGVSAAVLTPLTLGSSLLCTLLVALASAYFQHRRGAVLVRLMVIVGLCSALAVYLTTGFVTTQPWYTPEVFQVIFSVVLLTVVARMLLKHSGETSSDAPPPASADASQHSMAALFGTGTVAGAVSAAVGVGGGVVLVPAYNSFLRIPIHKAVGTSSATIVLISLAGVLTYSLRGLAADVPATALGYVDARALLLCLPALLTARWGVQAAHAVNVRALQAAFGLVAVLVAGRLLWGAFGG